MVIHVKDAEVDSLVRQLADARGLGITAAIKEAVKEALANDSAGRIDSLSLEERLKPLLDRLDKLPRSTTATDKAFFDREWGEGN
ncbi:MAG: type II toxin-antitoxin system VapB family antitoxin [Rhizobiaceae bacterium]|nr:type II toxin-antitoxin system VapB family antitoxin [Rhizobiaceae bacterium]